MMAISGPGQQGPLGIQAEPQAVQQQQQGGGNNLMSILKMLLGSATTYGAAQGIFGKKPVNSFLFGTPERYEQEQLYTPEQQSVLDMLLGQGAQNADFGGIENREVSRFNKETIPSIAERFTSMGAGGQRSSSFQGALGGAASDLGERLGSLRSQYGLQQLGQGLKQRYQTNFRPRESGFLEKVLPLGAKAATSFFTGGMF
jgi:hypothetical protein